jgi:hypothetical protein
MDATSDSPVVQLLDFQASNRHACSSPAPTQLQSKHCRPYGNLISTTTAAAAAAKFRLIAAVASAAAALNSEANAKADLFQQSFFGVVTPSKGR